MILQPKNFAKFSLILSMVWILFFFIFSKHYIEPTGVVEAWFSIKGLVYYKDFVTYHFPLGRWILIPFLEFFNLDFRPLPFLALFIAYSNLWLVYLFCKRYLSPSAAMISLFFFASFYWFFATQVLYYHDLAIGLFTTLVLLSTFYILEKKFLSFNKIFLFGTLCSTAELFGQIGSLTIILALIVIAWRITKGHLNSTYKFQSLLHLGLGFAFPILILSFYFATKNALSDFLFWNFLYYFEYAGNNKTHLLELPWFYILAFYTPMISLGCGMLFSKQKNNIPFFGFLFSLVTIPFTIFSIFHPHHFNYALPTLAIAAGISYDYLKSSNKHLFNLSILYVVSIMFLIIFPWYLQHLNYKVNYKIENDVGENPNDPMYQAVEWIKNNTPKSSKIQVTSDPLFFLRSDRLPANKYAKGIPTYFWKPFDKVKPQILSSLPDYWIIEKGFMRRLFLPSELDSPEMGDFINTELNACFVLKQEFDTWQIWQKKC